MSFLEGKKIVLGVTGSIAAYKSPLLLRELQKRGAQVKAVLTPAAEKFVSKLTLEILSGFKVYSDDSNSSPKIFHTELCRWGELFLIAPATANTVGKIAFGIGDTPVTEVALCFGRGILCPAMNVRMYENPVVQENLEKLKSVGWEVVKPEIGFLACGEEGKGRFPSIENILDCCEYWFMPKVLKGKKIVVTAGPTREYIDPVRFISNPSSGKMGYALAKVAKGMGASVVLVSGRTCLRPPYGVKRIEVETVDEMLRAVLSEFENCDVYVSAAAVGDFKPKVFSPEKIKKDENLKLELERTTDILKVLGKKKKKGQILVGFAAETENLLENAKKKLFEKNLDFVVANNVKEGIFGSDESKVKIIDRNGNVISCEGSKEQVAFGLFTEVAKHL
jgi:phosphopantothenoylcysteine decarboxylase/phosphopantothenate--cysteine ligase